MEIESGKKSTSSSSRGHKPEGILKACHAGGYFSYFFKFWQGS